MFTFKGYDLNKGEGTILFNYELEHEGLSADEVDENFSFVEKITFDPTRADFSRVPESVLTATLDTFSLILGISYWKLFCPEEIKLANVTLSFEQAKFWNTVYTKGLGEFFYKNQIDFRGLVSFPSAKGKIVKPKVVPKTGKFLVPWGGGKDSIVSAELLKKAGKNFDLISLNESLVQRETAKVAEKGLIIIKREIDPKLFELNKRPDVYNGHVPVSVIYSATALLASLLYGYDTIVISAEESANYGNVEYLGETINHQWSKSEEFEKMFSDYIKMYVTPSVTYKSLLRPYSELKITEMFSKYPQYLPVFSSCNKNFTIVKSSDKRLARTSGGGWCGECAKCAFVFALLAAYVPKAKVLEIFGKNLFNDPALALTYRKLLGLEAEKPFDCVGTPEETLAAFKLAIKMGKYDNDVIIREFRNVFLGRGLPERT